MPNGLLVGALTRARLPNLCVLCRRSRPTRGACSGYSDTPLGDTPLGLRTNDGRRPGQVRAIERVPPGVAAQEHLGWRLSQLPSRRFMSARHALEKHPLRAELQQVVVSVQPAVELPQPRERSRDDVIAQLTRLAGRIQGECDGVARSGRHVLSSFSRPVFKNAFLTDRNKAF